jgi:hypothetical protein
MLSLAAEGSASLNVRHVTLLSRHTRLLRSFIQRLSSSSQLLRRSPEMITNVVTLAGDSLN